MIACGGEGSIFAPPRPTGQGGGGSLNPTLFGEWEAVILIEAPPDIQTWTTRWRFDGDRTCRFRQVVVSALEGTTREKTRDCTWRDVNATIALVWQDSGVGEVLPYSFPSLNPNRLLLQGIEYRRAP